MATRAERTALIFVSAVVLVGAAVRLTRAGRHGLEPEPAAASALARQRRAVDSATHAPKSSRGETHGKERAPRIPPVARGGPAAQASSSARTKPEALRSPVDVDRASAAELDALPRVGAALAARIVTEREANGPFRSLDSLRARVKGIGPAMAKLLAPLVVFSGR